MRDVDTKCKGVHVKLDKDTHANFKIKLVQHGVTMQDAFEEFARLLGAGSPSANRMIERLVHEKVKKELTSVGLQPNRKRTARHDVKHVNVLDNERLYDLISEEWEEKDRQVPTQGGDHDEAA